MKKEVVKAQVQAMQLESQLQVQQLKERAGLLENTILMAKHKIGVLKTQVEFVPYPFLTRVLTNSYRFSSSRLVLVMSGSATALLNLCQVKVLPIPWSFILPNCSLSGMCASTPQIPSLHRPCPK